MIFGDVPIALDAVYIRQKANIRYSPNEFRHGNWGKVFRVVLAAHGNRCWVLVRPTVPV